VNSAPVTLEGTDSWECSETLFQKRCLSPHILVVITYLYIGQIFLGPVDNLFLLAPALSCE
jgi:hypothetical protein